MLLFKSGVFRWGLPFLGAFLLLRLFFWGTAFPNPDEAYYWLWGQHLGFSYYDHPPFHAWVQGTFAALLGRSTWVLRLPNLISNSVLLVTYYHICRYLFRERVADAFWVVVLLLVSSPLFFLFFAIAWNDHWLVTFSVVSSYAFVRFLDGYLADGRGNSRWLYGAALALGLAGLCKYNAIFVGLGFLATLLSHRRLRSLFGDLRLHGALAIALLTLSPIFIWNAQHDFISFQFYANRTTNSNRLHFNPLQPLVFLGLSSLILGPIQTWEVGQILKRKLDLRESLRESQVHSPIAPISVYWRVAFWIFTLSTGTFLLLSLLSSAIYYWNILAYPLLFPWMADLFLHAPNTSKAVGMAALLRQKRLLLAAQMIGLIAVTGIIFHYTVVPLTALIGFKGDDDSAALYDWPAIATEVKKQAATLDHPLLLTTDYRSASALAYQLNDPDVRAISGRRDQFDLWYDAQGMKGRQVVLLGEAWHPICAAHLAMFDHIDPPEQLQAKRFGLTLQTYTLVRGYGFKAGDSDRYPLQPNYPLAFTTDGEICAPK